MDIISSSTSLTSDLNSADTSTETLDPASSDNTSFKTGSLPDCQEDVSSNLSEVSGSVNSVENINNAGEDCRTITNVKTNIVDSDNVNEPEPEPATDKLDASNNKDSIECATSSVCETSEVCEQSKLNETKEAFEISDAQVNTTENSNDDTVSHNPENVINTVADQTPTETHSSDAKTLSEDIEKGPILDLPEEEQVPLPKSSEKLEGESVNIERYLSVDSEVTSSQDPVETEEIKTDAEIASETANGTRLFTEQSSESDTSKEKDSQLDAVSLQMQALNQKSSLVKAMPATETDTNTEDIAESEENQLQTNDALSEVDEQSMDHDMQQENPVFVHVGSKGDGETEGEKTLNSDVDLQNETGDESMEVTCLAEEDPIGITQENDKDELMDFSEEVNDKESIKVVDFNVDSMTNDKSTMDDELVASKGADEELCIIPDTEREISQEEKDAATAAAAAAAELPRSKDDSAISAETSPTAAIQTEETLINSSETTPNSTEENTQIVLDEEFMASVNNTSPDEADKPEIKVIEFLESEAPDEPCHQCRMVKKCIYKVDNNQEKPTFLCNETCLISFRTLNKPPLEGGTPVMEGLKLKDIAKKIPGTEANKQFVRKCAECEEKIKANDDKILCWETMDYCNEDCLSRYQNRIGSHCANCKKLVIMSSLGKYCVRFGHDIRQFCCSLCLEEFKKGLKVCSYCQKDISGGSEGFLAPVGDKGQFKDFCSQHCMEKYEQMSNKTSNNKFTLPAEISQCSVCTLEKQVQVVFDQKNKDDNKKHKFCSYPCFVAFRFVNQIDPPQCDLCKSFFETEDSTQFSIYYENLVKNFCCKSCQNIYIIANRRIVPCSWCKVKKYNFDMIKKSCSSGQILMMCSLNCLSLFQVSVNAVSSKKIKCDYCTKVSQAQYHLTMSDATIRNFCTYHCVMSFQSQFAKLPITITTGEKPVPKPVPASGPKKYSNRGNRSCDANSVNEVRMPVITNVESLANNGTASRPNSVKINNQQSSPQPPTSPKPQIRQQIIVKHPPMPPMKNVATMCKPILHTKGVSCRPHPSTKETQTDEIKIRNVMIPVPVPIYVPAPVHMFSAPVPVPIPFPLPIPVPVFIPTTRNSAAGIMKEIKKIQVKIPTDPFEAELLMMAEMVAGEKKVDNTDSESEEDDTGDAGADGGFSPEAVDTSNTFGDDMLQMALKMATELDEPAVDLEGALTANTITASQNQDNTAVVATEEAVDDPQPIHQLLDRQNIPIRGRKRTNRQPRNINNPAKRSRRMSSHVEMPLLPPPQPAQPPEPIEKPDANMCLKYTFGVNAWKQWVTTKNAELEKSSRRVKLFKNEILQLTADELNYSLCLFVKEVRKPNGTEYAPDTIYYLCLGIQQYLFENARIDNIFTDAYYEKFTDCLDEVARKFSVLYNDSHYIVTRVEEEHLWESKQLGAHSPHVLLSTLMFFNTKHFNLTTVDEHMQLSFSHIMKHWKRNPNQPGAAKIPGSRNVLLRFYPPQTTLDSNSRKKKVYEQQENEENPLRCPVKLYEFYLSKCPESVKTRNDVFYLLPERSCVPDSPVWYSTMALGREALEKMLHRVKMVKEINVALLTS